jgi:hypothetical protein
MLSRTLTISMVCFMNLQYLYLLSAKQLAHKPDGTSSWLALLSIFGATIFETLLVWHSRLSIYFLRLWKVAMPCVLHPDLPLHMFCVLIFLRQFGFGTW